MPYLYYSPDFQNHDTGSHPENRTRLEHVARGWPAEGIAAGCRLAPFGPASREALLRVHGAEHLATLDALAASGGGKADADTVVSPCSVEVARLAAGAACEATRKIVAGESTTAFCAVRPPGHHALADRAMGFCLFNNIAVAARLAIDELGLDRLLVVDWDVHHGNGAQDLFYSDGRVGFFSAHRWPFYPGTGAADETGAGDGLGATRNLPVSFGTSRDRYLSWFARELADFADLIRPQLVLVSAGFDSHHLDPIGSLGLETEDFADLTRIVLDVAATHAGGRVVSVLEGGYNPPVLAECVATHLATLAESEAEAEPPKA
ncbi:MAG: histone deacetylase [Planctomycetota bacterium]